MSLRKFGDGELLGGSDSEESTCNVGDLGLIPGLGRSPGEGKGYPLQYSGMENSMEKSMGLQRPSDFHFTYYFYNDNH